VNKFVDEFDLTIYKSFQREKNEAITSGKNENQRSQAYLPALGQDEDSNSYRCRQNTGCKSGKLPGRKILRAYHSR
jgi:hypothetical protein